ncbi:MAG: hypothetical protein V1684_00815 [bacterium]
MSAKFFAYSIMVLAVVLVIITGAFAVGYKLGDRQSSEPGNAFSVPPENFKSISGVIKNISQNYLEIEGIPLSPEISPCAIPSKVSAKAIISSQTKILRQRMKTGAEMKAETKDNLPSSPLILEPIEKDDLKIGNRVMVAAVENLKDKAEFIATSVILINI